ncbi:MAG: hypothetical protein ACK4L7_05495 [Flavobacteriales bacterium]
MTYLYILVAVLAAIAAKRIIDVRRLAKAYAQLLKQQQPAERKPTRP